jgi:hypothetical protein
MDDGDPALSDPTISWFSSFLDEDDDPELWQVVLDHILAEFETEPDVLIEVGRCSHWLRPTRLGGRLVADSPGPPGTAVGVAVTATRHSLSSIGRSFSGGREAPGNQSSEIRSGVRFD